MEMASIYWWKEGIYSFPTNITGFYNYHLLLVQKKFFWAFNIASNFCFLIFVFYKREKYQVPQDEEIRIQHTYYTSPQAFHLPCHSSNHSQISSLCASRQQGSYLFMHFISTILSLTNLSFRFFLTNCCLLSQRSPTLLSKTLPRCILYLSN